MAGMARCLRDANCIKKDTCLRYLDTMGEIMNMPSICNESNNYEWYRKAETQIQTTKDNKYDKDSKTKENQTE
jgi:hypothetical protein